MKTVCFKSGVQLSLAALVLAAMSFLLKTPAAAMPGPKDSGGLSSVDRSIIEQMLKDMAEAVKKDYYDPALGGIDFNADYAQSKAAITRATSVHEGYEAVANLLRKLDDSHTHFVPPQQPFTIEPGFAMQMIGDKCFVTRVKRGSDADAKGLLPGDEISMIDGVKPARDNWEDMNYTINLLAPRSSLHLVVTTLKDQPRALTTQSVVKERRKLFDLTGVDLWNFIHQRDADLEKNKSYDLIVEDVYIIKLHDFLFSETALDGRLHKAEKYKALILDLRGNPGGSVALLTRMLGNVFDHEVQVAQAIGRAKSRPEIAKPVSHPYTGQLIVLVDSNSASASELFARVVQIEKRGTVIGDRTAGAVRQANFKQFVHGQGTVFAYAIEVTTADLKMSDGKSLEKVGVVPDETVLPTPDQLAAGEDPQMARALQLAGVSMSPKKAGALFPSPEM
jgi:carboxyl-terminal processing protease